MIVEVNDRNLFQAATIHSISWKESHNSFCSNEFVEKHTIERQMEYLATEISLGKTIYMLIDNEPVAIVSVKDNLIENLYVLPKEQGKGYGTELLLFAISKCVGVPTLWILNNNERAYSLYQKQGFCLSGNTKRLSDTLSEIEMIFCSDRK